MKTAISLCAFQIATLLIVNACPLSLQADVDPEDFFGRLTINGQFKVPYYRTSPLNRQNLDVERAVIAIHGYGLNAASTFSKVYDVVDDAGALHR